MIDFGGNYSDKFYCAENSGINNYNAAKSVLSAAEIELLVVFNKLDGDIAKGKAIAKIEALVEQQEAEKADKRAKDSKIKRSC